MIQGLGYLLTQIQDYETLTNTAQNGNRDIIDLKVKHIYQDSTPPIPGDLTAANFGNVLHNLNDNFTDADKLASVMGVVGEVVTTMAITVAREHNTDNVVFIGSSFYNNNLLQKVVEGEVFAEWQDELRDDDKAVAVDLKPGVIGTVVSAQKLIDKITF